MVSLNHQNCAKDNSEPKSSFLLILFSFLPLIGAAKAFPTHFAFIIGFTGNCIGNLL